MAACLLWLQFHSKVVYLVKSYGIECHRIDVFVRLIFHFLIPSCITFSFVLSLFLAEITMVWCPFLAASMLGALQLLLGGCSFSISSIHGRHLVPCFVGRGLGCLCQGRQATFSSKALQNGTGSYLLMWMSMLEQMGFNVGNTKGVSLIQLVEPFHVRL